MKKLIPFMGMILMLILQGCSSEQEPTASDSQETDAPISHIVVKFDGKVYESDVKVIGDETIFLNEEYAALYRSKIETNPNIAAIMSNDDNGTSYVEYFSSEKELLESYNLLQPDIKSDDFSTPVSRGGTIDMMPANNTSPVIAVAELYDDRNFKDTKLISYATTTWATGIPRLKELGFNDKASSIKVYNKMNPNTSYEMTYISMGVHSRRHLGSGLRPVLKCFHNSDYSGSVIYCISKPTGNQDIHADYNLKNIGWNDRISAIMWVIVCNFSLFEGESPEIPAHKDC